MNTWSIYYCVVLQNKYVIKGEEIINFESLENADHSLFIFQFH